jgi:putative FmdB family regulatory protein
VPTYQYTCTECGQSLEAVQSFSDPALSECPACQGKLRKVFNSVGIVFKGSGFYRTDSRAGAVGAESAKSEGKSESKSDSSATSSSSSDSGKSADKSSSTSTSNGSSSSSSS